MITVKHLTKTFDHTPALVDLSMQVNQGAIYGLVGLNGAGKSTLIKHIAGVLPAAPGVVCISGMDVYDNPAAKLTIGYVPDEPFFFPSYGLAAMARVYRGLYPTFCQDRFRHLTGMFELNIKRKLSGFSKGMQKQAALSLVLACAPKVLLLDEPMDGLDPIARQKMFSYIHDDVAARQMSVLISSHNLKEMDVSCDTVGILRRGRMIVQSDLDTIKAEYGQIGPDGQTPTLDEIFVTLHTEVEHD